jgi:hypothetical protein
VRRQNGSGFDPVWNIYSWDWHSCHLANRQAIARAVLALRLCSVQKVDQAFSLAAAALTILLDTLFGPAA